MQHRDTIALPKGTHPFLPDNLLEGFLQAELLHLTC